jgi:PKD repeat protein
MPGTSGARIDRIHWDWGDGRSENRGFPATHTYARDGTYEIRVTSYQSDGLSTTRSDTVSVQKKGSTAKMDVHVSASINPVLVGEFTELKVIVFNVGDVVLASVWVEIHPSSGFEYDQGDTRQQVEYLNPGSAQTFTLTLAPRESLGDEFVEVDQFVRVAYGYKTLSGRETKEPEGVWYSIRVIGDMDWSYGHGSVSCPVKVRPGGSFLVKFRVRSQLVPLESAGVPDYIHIVGFSPRRPWWQLGGDYLHVDGKDTQTVVLQPYSSFHVVNVFRIRVDSDAPPGKYAIYAEQVNEPNVWLWGAVMRTDEKMSCLVEVTPPLSSDRVPSVSNALSYSGISDTLQLRARENDSFSSEPPNKDYPDPKSEFTCMPSLIISCRNHL